MHSYKAYKMPNKFAISGNKVTKRSALYMPYLQVLNTSTELPTQLNQHFI